jgi:predicted AlkP superfamily phosphohydrolase/phosphomutase
MLRATIDPPFYAEYFFGFDVVGHSFLRYAEPERFGNVKPDEVRSYGRIVDAYAAFLSRVVADLAASLRPREILVVASGYGMETVSLGHRLRSGLLGGGAASGTHVDAPEGFILAVGDGVRAGARLENASVLDVTPTILYLMGLPVARDMEGRVASEILDEEFARSHPVAFIPSYESLAVTPIAGAEALELPPLPEEAP